MTGKKIPNMQKQHQEKSHNGKSSHTAENVAERDANLDQDMTLGRDSLKEGPYDDEPFDSDEGTMVSRQKITGAGKGAKQ